MKKSYQFAVLLLCLANVAESVQPGQAMDPGAILKGEAFRAAGLTGLGVVAGGAITGTGFDRIGFRLGNEVAGGGLGILASHVATQAFNANSENKLSTWNQFIGVVIGGFVGMAISGYFNGHKK